MEELQGRHIQHASQHQAISTLISNLSCQVQSPTHHDSFAFVLDDMTGPANFIPSSKTKEHEFISWVYWLFVCRRHWWYFALGRHREPAS
jgi:hypothetical protein